MPQDLNALALPELYEALCRREPGRSLTRRIIELARDEDQPQGDVTSEMCIPEDAQARGVLSMRADPGTLAGVRLVHDVLELLAPRCRWNPFLADGDTAPARAAVGTIEGPAREVLAAERPVLNFLARLSGVATRTRMYADALPRDTKARVYDTRKTTPGLRMLEKFAVRCGGGLLHRLSLSDAVLIKDNHIAGLTPAALAARARGTAERARERYGDRLRFVQVEVSDLDQLTQVLETCRAAVDIILLDNMDIDSLGRAAELRDRLAPDIRLEASGGVTLDRIAAIARTGIDRISTGDLTHHAVWLDVGLDFE